MINKIINFSVHNRFFVFIMTFILIILGYKSFESLSIDAVPDITNVQVQINTPVKGLVPEEIERMITLPLEYTMNGIPGVETIRSISRYGISQVTIIFRENTSVFQARQMVSEKLMNIDLGKNIKPQIGPLSSGLGEIFHYSVAAKIPEKDPSKRLIQLMELKSIQDWFIKPRLLSVQGVTEVNTIGGFEKQYFIQPDIKMLTRYGLHFDDIEKAIESTNLNVGGSYIEQTGEQLLVRGLGLLNTINDIENVVVKRLPDYKIVKIKDIAKVTLDKEVRTGAASLNGEEAIIGTTFMLLGGNSRVVSNAVREKLQQIKNDIPSWVEIEFLYDRSKMVKSTLDTVEHNLLMGAGLVILFLMLLVGNIRAAIITSLIIPISLLITFILMKWQNVSGNLMSLGALDFGIIVDGAVIVIESCVSRIQKERKILKRNLTRNEIKEMVRLAAIEIRSAAGFGELIVIIVFLPLFALVGVEGKMFGPMAMTFIMALCSALLLSFTLVPALAATFLNGDIKEEVPYLMKLFEKLFSPLINQGLKVKKLIFTIGVLSIVLGIFLFNRLGSEFIPQLDEGDFAIQFIRPANINMTSSIELQKMSEKLIVDFPQVSHVFARTGAAEVATDPMGVNISDSYVMLKDIDAWPKDSSINSKNELIKAIKSKLEQNIPGQVIMISQPVELRFNELLEGTRADISAKIFGEDLDKLILYANQLSQILKQIEGSGEVESESKGKSPMLQYSSKHDELSFLGVTSRPVLDTISTAIGGKMIGHIYDGVKRFPIMTRLSQSDRESVNSLQNLPVGISSNYTVPISQVASLEFIETFSAITRENSQRRIAVLINPNTRDIESFVNNAMIEVSKKLKMDEGYYIEWGGSFKNLKRAKEDLSLLIPLSMLIILVLLYGVFKNFFQVILIFACAPLALIGGVVFLNIFDIPFSISAGVGFIALSGISVLNGVVLVSYFNRLGRDGFDPDEIARLGVRERLRPVLMTALTDIFGFLPMMFSTGLGSEVQKPLATVVVGGIFSATFLTLLVLPCLYSLFYKYPKIHDNDVA